jgi:hypothetical protein
MPFDSSLSHSKNWVVQDGQRCYSQLDFGTVYSMAGPSAGCIGATAGGPGAMRCFLLNMQKPCLSSQDGLQRCRDPHATCVCPTADGNPYTCTCRTGWVAGTGSEVCVPAHEQCDGDGSLWAAGVCYRLIGSANTYLQARDPDSSTTLTLSYLDCAFLM